MSKLTKIYIPTLNRVGFNRQVTLRELLDHSSWRPTLICPPDELKDHKRYYKKVVVCDRDGIGPTRQWILENSTADIVIMMDDDMRFSYRPNPTSIKLERCTNLDPMINLIVSCVNKGFIHGGISARQGNNRKTLQSPRQGRLVDGHVIVDCDRVNNLHFMDRAAVVKLARMDCLPVMEDFHFTLALLSLGHPNRVIYDYVWNQQGSGQSGGCSSYRTAQVQSAGAEGLFKAFPKYVKLVEKNSKDISPAWKDFKTRKDVIVQWYKCALDHGAI